MRPWKLTAVLFALPIVPAGCFAPGLLTVYKQYTQTPPEPAPAKAQLDEAASRHTADPQIALGYALIAADQPASAMATLGLALLPALAALLAFATLMFLIIYASAVHDSHVAMQVLDQGELHVLGLR